MTNQANVVAEGNDATARSSRMMMWMMPLMSLWIGFTLPAALGVYWIVNSLLYAIQEKALTKYYKNHMEDELSEKEKQKREDRLRRMEAARERQRKFAADVVEVTEQVAESEKAQPEAEVVAQPEPCLLYTSPRQDHAGDDHHRLHRPHGHDRYCLLYTSRCV